MLRRVARVLRIALFALGVFFLTCLPASFLFHISASHGGSYGRWAIGLSLGGVKLSYWYASEVGQASWTRVDVDEPRFNHWSEVSVWPYGYLESSHLLELPLWLLAAICLAWPVTSFIVARWRRSRGFAVELTPEPQGGGAAGAGDVR